MKNIYNMMSEDEVITKLFCNGKENELHIETECVVDDIVKTWFAWIKIHNPYPSKQVICHFMLNDIELNQDTVQIMLGCTVLEKTNTQYDEWNDEVGAYIHMTKLGFKLKGGHFLEMKVGDSYLCEGGNEFCYGRLKHTGKDGFKQVC